MRSRFVPFVLALSILILAAAPGRADDLVQQGRKSFGLYCVRCHGPEGHGDGPDAVRLYVPPRDLTSGIFKFKTTTSGTPPSDRDLLKGIISHGITGSGMPSFATLDDGVKDGLVAYVKSISPAFSKGIKPDPIAPPVNMKARVDAKRGAELYKTLQCFTCHGQHGRANGPSAFTMMDVWKHPIRPANLAEPWAYGGGADPLDIYYRLLAGIDASGMPSYSDALAGMNPNGWRDDAWQLANYVASLQISPNFTMRINAAKSTGELPTKADDAAWANAPRTDVAMDDYYVAGGHRQMLTVVSSHVQALYDDHGVTFRVFWDDPIQNTDKSPDAFLIAFKPSDYEGDPRGNLHNLYETPGSLLNFSAWKASDGDHVREQKASVPALLANWDKGQIAPAQAVYDDGRWILVFHRAFDESQGFSPNASSMLVSFAAWDGSNGETGEKHSSSQWIRLHLGTADDAHH